MYACARAHARTPPPHTHIVYCKLNIPPHMAYIPNTVFSLSVPSTLRSSRFFNFPGASAIGKDEWNINSLPEHSDA